MIEQRFVSLGGVVFFVNEHIAVSARFRGTSYIFDHRRPVAHALHIHIGSILTVLRYEADLFVSTICYNTVYIALLSTYRRICTPVLIDTPICVQHVRPEQN